MEKNYYLVSLICLIFFVISFFTNILGALNPEAIQSFSLSHGLSSLLPFAFFIAYGIMSIPSGMLVERYKEKKIMAAAFCLSLAGALLFSIFPGYIVFLISLFLMGSAMAMLQVAINPLLRISGGEKNFAFYSVLAQLIFGAASFLAPMCLKYLVTNLKSQESSSIKLIFSSLLPSGLYWVSLYWVFSLISLLMIIIVMFSEFPAVERNEDEKTGTWKLHKKLFTDKTVILFFLGIFCYVGTEQGVSYWLSEFLHITYGYDPISIGASAVAWFWGMMSVGCLAGLLLLKLFDSRKVLFGAVLFALVFLTMSLFFNGETALVTFPLIGFSLSVMWSIIFSLGLNSVKSHHGSVSGILCTAIIGGAVIQLIIGWLSDSFGLQRGMLFIYITLFYILSISIWAKPLINNETIDIRKLVKGKNVKQV